MATGSTNGAQEGLRTVRMQNFPASWLVHPRDVFIRKMAKLVTNFGELETEPVIEDRSDGVVSVLATFVAAADAKKAQTALHNVDNRSRSLKEKQGTEARPEDLFSLVFVDPPPAPDDSPVLQFTLDEVAPLDANPSTDEGEKFREVFFAALPLEDYNEQELRDWIFEFGEVDRFFLVKDPETNVASGPGFAKFATKEQANDLLAAFSDQADFGASWSRSERLLEHKDLVLSAFTKGLPAVRSEIPNCTYLAAKLHSTDGPFFIEARPKEALKSDLETVKKALEKHLPGILDRAAAAAAATTKATKTATSTATTTTSSTSSSGPATTASGKALPAPLKGSIVTAQASRKSPAETQSATTAAATTTQAAAPAPTTAAPAAASHSRPVQVIQDDEEQKQHKQKQKQQQQKQQKQKQDPPPSEPAQTKMTTEMQHPARYTPPTTVISTKTATMPATVIPTKTATTPATVISSKTATTTPATIIPNKTPATAATTTTAAATAAATTAVAATTKQQFLRLAGFPNSWGEKQVKLTFAIFGGIKSVAFEELNGERVAHVLLKSPDKMSKAISQLHNAPVGDGELIEECTITVVLEDRQVPVGDNEDEAVALAAPSGPNRKAQPVPLEPTAVAAACKSKPKKADMSAEDRQYSFLRVILLDELDLPKRPTESWTGMEREVFLSCLPVEDVSEEGMRGHFAEFGEVTDFLLLTDRSTGKKSGQGYVTFRTHEEARKCIEGTMQEAQTGDILAYWSESERASNIEDDYGRALWESIATSSGKILQSVLAEGGATDADFWILDGSKSSTSAKTAAKLSGAPPVEDNHVHIVGTCTDEQWPNLLAAFNNALTKFHEQALSSGYISRARALQAPVQTREPTAVPHQAQPNEPAVQIGSSGPSRPSSAQGSSEHSEAREPEDILSDHPDYLDTFMKCQDQLDEGSALVRSGSLGKALAKMERGVQEMISLAKQLSAQKEQALADAVLRRTEKFNPELRRLEAQIAQAKGASGDAPGAQAEVPGDKDPTKEGVPGASSGKRRKVKHRKAPEEGANAAGEQEAPSTQAPEAPIQDDPGKEPEKPRRRRKVKHSDKKNKNKDNDDDADDNNNKNEKEKGDKEDSKKDKKDDDSSKKDEEKSKHDESLVPADQKKDWKDGEALICEARTLWEEGKPIEAWDKYGKGLASLTHICRTDGFEGPFRGKIELYVGEGERLKQEADEMKLASTKKKKRQDEGDEKTDVEEESDQETEKGDTEEEDKKDKKDKKKTKTKKDKKDKKDKKETKDKDKDKDKKEKNAKKDKKRKQKKAKKAARDSSSSSASTSSSSESSSSSSSSSSDAKKASSKRTKRKGVGFGWGYGASRVGGGERARVEVSRGRHQGREDERWKAFSPPARDQKRSRSRREHRSDRNRDVRDTDRGRFWASRMREGAYSGKKSRSRGRGGGSRR